MNHRNRVVMWLAGIAVFVVLVGGLAAVAWADCNTYYNSHVVWDPYWGTYCGGSGGSCTECTGSGGESCHTEGTSCELDVKSV